MTEAIFYRVTQLVPYVTDIASQTQRVTGLAFTDGFPELLDLADCIHIELSVPTKNVNC